MRMRRQHFSITLIACGALMMLLGVGSLPAQRVAMAEQQVLQDPSPRPPISSTPEGGNVRERDEDDGGGSGGGGGGNGGVPTGRVTGTVIDLTTGAPTSGMDVNVGGVLTTTDENGNYDIYLEPGSYGVSLLLGRLTGVPAQGVQFVQVQANTTVVVHLGFYSQASPQGDSVAPPQQPVSAAQSDVQFNTMSVDVAPQQAAAQPLQAVAPAVPSQLPHTSGTANGALLWLVGGALMVAAGAAMRPYATNRIKRQSRNRP